MVFAKTDKKDKSRKLAYPYSMSVKNLLKIGAASLSLLFIVIAMAENALMSGSLSGEQMSQHSSNSDVSAVRGLSVG